MQWSSKFSVLIFHHNAIDWLRRHSFISLIFNINADLQYIEETMHTGLMFFTAGRWSIISSDFIYGYPSHLQISCRDLTTYRHASKQRWSVLRLKMMRSTTAKYRQVRGKGHSLETSVCLKRLAILSITRIVGFCTHCDVIIMNVVRITGGGLLALCEGNPQADSI